MNAAPDKLSDPAQRRTIEWLANGEVGQSSKTIALYLAFGQTFERGENTPRDPADFDRCLKLLAAVPELRSNLAAMTVFERWAPLVARWDELEACHLEEVGLGWTKARSAPKTYALMKSIPV